MAKNRDLSKFPNAITVLDNGNVGIGTTSPSAILEVARNNGGSTGGQLALRNNSGSTLNSTTEISFLNDTGASGTGTRNGRIISQMDNIGNGASSMQFWTWNGSTDAERMRIDADGITRFKFQSDRGIRMKGAQSSYSEIAGYQVFTENIRELRLTGSTLQFYSGDGSDSTGSERLRITETGNLGMSAKSIYAYGNIRPGDNGYGGVDFYNNGFGYAYSTKFYTFKSPDQSEMYGFTNDYGSGTAAELAMVAKQSSIGNIGFYTGTSTTAKMRINVNGAVTKPSNPAFRAYYSVNNIWTLSGGATFNFNSTEYNIGNSFNTSNGAFTAPVAGVYQFNFYTIVLGNYANASISFRKNGGTLTSGYNVHFSPYYTSSMWSNVVYTTSVYLNANDYVYMINNGGTTDFHGKDWSSFSGYLVG